MRGRARRTTTPHALNNVFTYTIDEPEQMTPDFFKKLEKQYRPKQVIIEYNGMWSIEPLYPGGSARQLDLVSDHVPGGRQHL